MFLSDSILLLARNSFIDHRCENDGQCVDTVSGYLCQCTSGWDGQYCEHVEDLCEKDEPCKNGATCIAQFRGYKCLCEPGDDTYYASTVAYCMLCPAV